MARGEAKETTVVTVRRERCWTYSGVTAELEFLFLLIRKLLILLLLTRLQLAFRISRWKLVPPTIYSVSDSTMIRCSDSPTLSGRQGAQSAQRWTVFHQGGPRAALHANQLRVIRRAAQHPVHPHGQLAGHGDFRHRGPTTKLQTLIHPLQLRDRSAPPCDPLPPTTTASSGCLAC